jgi:plasmid stability protein
MNANAKPKRSKKKPHNASIGEQFTIRNIPPHVARLLRERAARSRKSLNTTLVEALVKEAGLANEPVRFHDLDELAGQWVEDPAFDEALQAQDFVDESIWK